MESMSVDALVTESVRLTILGVIVHLLRKRLVSFQSCPCRDGRDTP